MVKALPRHVAIIMDGNGRWATQRGLVRTMGHKAGVASLKKAIVFACERKLEYLSFFAFSLENWQRPTAEVDYLLNKLVKFSLARSLAELKKRQIRLCFIGDLTRLKTALQQKLREIEAATAMHTGLTVIIALSYSGQWDITQAARKLSCDVAAQRLTSDQITQECFATYLTTAAFPPPDLLIRTSGEQRISNFMLWQLAYTELYFTPVLWPDFAEQDFQAALSFYQTRERRFGKC